jgi:adenylyltransferase/sulfurtransferase
MQFRTIKVRRDPECPACGTREIKELIDYDAFCGVGAATHEAAVKDISPRELQERIRRGDRIELIDVREDWEWQIGRIPGARLLPLGDLSSQKDRIDRSRDVVVYCKSGVRSLRAAEELIDAGFENVLNLSGGILRWSEDVDPTVVRY